jgi:hypothetical protein
MESRPISRRRAVSRKTARRITLSIGLYGAPFSPVTILQRPLKLLFKYQEDIGCHLELERYHLFLIFPNTQESLQYLNGSSTAHIDEM